MGEDTKIQWCDHTANFWEGCSKAGAGCKNCYAEAWERRLGNDIWGNRKPRKWTKGGPALIRKLQRKAAAADRIDKVFVNDLSDFFEDHSGRVIDHEGRTVHVDPNSGEKFSSDLVVGKSVVTLDILRREAFPLFDKCPNLIFQLLTKRPENIRKMLDGKFRKNVWLGVSIANQEDADRNIPLLLQCRDLAPVRFVSYEPAVGHVDFRKWLPGNCGNCGKRIKGYGYCQGASDHFACGYEVKSGKGLSWVIVGGESGPNARPFNIEWARSTVRQCADAGVPCFVKQMGSRSYMEGSGGERFNWPCGYTVNDGKTWLNLKAKKGDSPNEWPSDLRVREFPHV